jgi:predicted metallopeptidase
MALKWEDAPDVHAMMREIAHSIGFHHVRPHRVFCFRSRGSKSRALARIWSLPRIFQRALGIEAAYVLEVCHPRFDKLPPAEKEKTIIHELLHIPKNFSGAVVPHRGFGKHIDDKAVESLHRLYAMGKKA